MNASERLPGPDVVRAVALIGVVVMNYHGYLALRDGGSIPDSTAVERFFDPLAGPLSTRFAATFVLTAGVGITLLTRRVVAAQESTAITSMRWRLVRRGLVLYALGLLLDEIWHGTIILYYGAMFVVAAVLFTLASRWIVAVGVGAALAAWWIATWSFRQIEQGRSATWLTESGADSIRGHFLDLAVNGTHPLLPWLAFLCAGIVVGRYLHVPEWRMWCGGAGLAVFAVATGVSLQADTVFTDHVLSPDPSDRSMAYVAAALGVSLAAFASISWLADHATGRAATLIDPLRRAGQMTLTLYIAHVLVFNLVVDWLDLVQPDGLETALAFACAFWVVAIAAGAAWHRRFGRGPAERVYRAIGG